MYKGMMQNKFLKIYIIVAFLITASFLAGYFVSIKINVSPSENFFSIKKPFKPLEQYTIENLGKSKYSGDTIEMGQIIEENDAYSSRQFVFRFAPETMVDTYKNTTGVVNIPLSKDTKKWPLVVLIRGYVDQKLYKSGDGTKNVSRFLATNNFLTISLDYLGYAGSDSEAGNIFESRFQTYTATLSLIKSIENGILNDYWDGKNIFIWGHSNGGQIALTILSASEGGYPTVLWAPVSKPFPYSILYYTDESEDNGKLIRSELSKFEKIYDVEKYSLTNYLDKIKAPIELHQGTDDDAVPVSWSDALVAKMKSLDKDIKYIKHIGADHNMQPDWDNAARQSFEFYNEHLL